MLRPYRGRVTRPLVGLRSAPADNAELVDQAHYGEVLTDLGILGEWMYVQGEDQYLGWTRREGLELDLGVASFFIVAVPLAILRSSPDPAAAHVGYLPAGAAVHRHAKGDWIETEMGWLARTDTTLNEYLIERPPAADDLIQTAESFIGVPYLWGGTTALGLDCSGFVQQVYRLNGVALPRDADQQAVLGRKVEEARAGDLMFFGADAVTHVALATSATEFIHAPMSGAVVERGRLGGDRKLLGIRRYLPDVPVA